MNSCSLLHGLITNKCREIDYDYREIDYDYREIDYDYRDINYGYVVVIALVRPPRHLAVSLSRQ